MEEEGEEEVQEKESEAELIILTFAASHLGIRSQHT